MCMKVYAFYWMASLYSFVGVLRADIREFFEKDG